MKLIWPGINAKGTVLINLEFESFLVSKVPVLVDSLYYTPKDELHVTLVGEKVGLILQHKIKQDLKNIEVLVHIFESIDWAFNKSGPVHILSRSNKSKVQNSIIMLIDMPGMTTFYQQLKSSGLIPGKTPIPPAHVTLYTYNCPFGIGVPSNKTLRSLSKKNLAVKEFNDLWKNYNIYYLIK